MTVSSPWPSLLREMESQDLLCSIAAATGDRNPELDKIVWALGSLSPLLLLLLQCVWYQSESGPFRLQSGLRELFTFNAC